MTNDNDDDERAHKSQKLAFMLSQLRDDIDEIVSGLQSGRLAYGVACAATHVQLSWVLNQVQSGLPPTE